MEHLANLADQPQIEVKDAFTKQHAALRDAEREKQTRLAQGRRKRVEEHTPRN